ncbi:hypothetical protein SBOR_9109 [Sclerotinia borealis F-4128]|uniref:Uncharacterized protein n=1 Tax=Sclerotinia borealis (strain F-4128) TaxID=1432307 RepID=W9C470_SCLBF|nr:hypothetical protein SBOR_9109 [Sclerotinia borealis F-4128]
MSSERPNSSDNIPFPDAPSREPPAQSARFAYEYAAILDDDSEWGLEPVSAEKQAITPTEQQFQKWNSILPENCHVTTEALAFHNILKAMYHRPITMRSFHEFSNTIRLADFYCALPILSASTDSILLNLIPSPHPHLHPNPHPHLHSQPLIRARKKKLSNWLCTHTLPMLLIAYKLHHAPLFHDALIFVVGSWPRMLKQFENTKSPEWDWVGELQYRPTLRKEVEYGIAQLTELQSSIATRLRREAAKCPQVSHIIDDIESGLQREDPSYTSYAKCGALETAGFYRELRWRLRCGLVPKKWQGFMNKLDGLLGCELVLVDEVEVKVMGERFWCVGVGGEEGELPWGEEVDW